MAKSRSVYGRYEEAQEKAKETLEYALRVAKEGKANKESQKEIASA